MKCPCCKSTEIKVTLVSWSCNKCNYLSQLPHFNDEDIVNDGCEDLDHDLIEAMDNPTPPEEEGGVGFDDE